MTFTKFQIAAAKRAALSIKQLRRQEESAKAKINAYDAKINSIQEKIADMQNKLVEMQSGAAMLRLGLDQFQSQIDAFNAPFISTYSMTAEEVAIYGADTEVAAPAAEEDIPAPTADDEPAPSIDDAYDAEGNYVGNWPNDVVGYAGQNNQ